MCSAVTPKRSNQQSPGDVAGGVFDDRRNYRKTGITTELVSTTEQEDFARLDGVVRRGLATFVEIGEALREIRDRKLYRIGFATFEAYMSHEHGLSRMQGHRLIESAAVHAEMQNVTHGLHLPQNERQCRELLAYDDADRQEVWQQALEQSESTGRPITARMIREIGKPYRAPSKPEPEKPQPAGQSRGLGVQRAHEAIACLKMIPYSDGLKDRAFDIVAAFIEDNYGVDDAAVLPEPDEIIPPREGFDLLMEQSTAMNAVRAAFSHWPEEYREFEVPEVLKTLLVEDFHTW